jgi:hypothetical protein
VGRSIVRVHVTEATCVCAYLYLSIYLYVCVSVCGHVRLWSNCVCVCVHVYVQLTGSGDAYVGEVDYADGDHSANLKLVNPRVRAPPPPSTL